MGRPTKKHLQKLFIEQFLRRLKELPSGERLYMAAADLFMDAEEHGIHGQRSTDDDEGGSTFH